MGRRPRLLRRPRLRRPPRGCHLLVSGQILLSKSDGDHVGVERSWSGREDVAPQPVVSPRVGVETEAIPHWLKVRAAAIRNRHVVASRRRACMARGAWTSSYSSGACSDWSSRSTTSNCRGGRCGTVLPQHVVQHRLLALTAGPYPPNSKPSKNRYCVYAKGRPVTWGTGIAM